MEMKDKIKKLFDKLNQEVATLTAECKSFEDTKCIGTFLSDVKGALVINLFYQLNKPNKNRDGLEDYLRFFLKSSQVDVDIFTNLIDKYDSLIKDPTLLIPIVKETYDKFDAKKMNEKVGRD